MIDPNNLGGTATLTFADEFNTFKAWDGTSGWDTKWYFAPQQGTAGYNNEQEWYINKGYAPTGAVNPWVANGGDLHLLAQQTNPAISQYVGGLPYTSGMINSYHEFTQTYGYFEMKAELPQGQGLWPAFWLLNANGTTSEIDVMEQLGNAPSTWYSNVHSTTAGPITGGVHTGTDTSTGYHTYGLNWTADKLQFYMDGQKYYETATPADMHSPMYMIANLAVGGNWPGSPNASTQFPAEMKIDYIHVYKDGPPPATAPVVAANDHPPTAIPVVAADDEPPAATPLVTAHDQPPSTTPVVTAHDQPAVTPIVTAHDQPPVATPVVATDNQPPVTPPVVTAHDQPAATTPVVTAHDQPPAATPVVAANDHPPTAPPIVEANTPPPATEAVAHVLNAGDLYFENKFNDATRVLEGGLWHNNVPVGNQGHGTDGRYVADLTFVQTGLAADVAAGDFTGAQLAHVNTVLADITTALGSVQGAVNNSAAAEATLRAAHLDIINVIQSDPTLQALSIKDHNPGFNFAPAELATPLNNNTPHATFAELGAIFDDAQSRSLGGINANNLPAIDADLHTVHDGLIRLMNDHPQLFGGETGVHATTIVDQINLQLTNFDHQYGFNPDAAKATNDNFLDITDIVSGDANLANMASANGVTGWTPAPATDVVPVAYQDNADQTNFWADFIASSNTLGARAEQLVSTGNSHEIKAFINTLTGWENNVSHFDAAQGGVFEARFDNELLGKNSTVGADVEEMIKGLQTHNATLVKAAADGFHANAADVSGNNVPLNGGTYNGDGQTIAEALNTATGALPPAPVALLTPASQTAGNAAVACAGSGHAGDDHHVAQAIPAPAAFEHHQEFHHQWGFG